MPTHECIGREWVTVSHMSEERAPGYTWCGKTLAELRGVPGTYAHSGVYCEECGAAISAHRRKRRSRQDMCDKKPNYGTHAHEVGQDGR